MRRCFIILFLLIFCCGCAPKDTAAPTETVPTPSVCVTSEWWESTEVESFYDTEGRLTEEVQTKLDKTGRLAATVSTQYNQNREVSAYIEKHYGPEGGLTESLIKEYENNALIRQEQVFYWENMQPQYVNRCNFDIRGEMLESFTWEYASDGTLLSQRSDNSDESTGLRLLQQKTMHPNGAVSYICDGIFHPLTYELLGGTVSVFDESGVLLRLDEATWDEACFKSTGSCTEYDMGEVAHFSQYSTEYDQTLTLIASEHIIYEAGMLFASHYAERYTYDDRGLLIQNEISYFLEDGSQSEQHLYTYGYNDLLQLVNVQNIHNLTPDLQQNRTVTEYTYGEGGNLIQEVQTGFDKDDNRTFQTVKSYDPFGVLTTFSTVSNLGNRYTYTYTYDEEGRQISELMTTHYRSGPRIDYQKSIWEYHENGKYKTVSIQKWTSYDETKYPNADPAAWGKTTVTHYDENGNKIKK